MTSRRRPEPSDLVPANATRVFLEYPVDWNDMTENEQMAVARGMAIELQRQLGITPQWCEGADKTD